MVAKVALVAAVVAAMALAVGTTAPAGPPRSMLPSDLAGAPQVPSDGTVDGFDGRLYPDPETGCIRPWREGDGDPVTGQDAWGPRVVPLDPSVQVQDPRPLPEPFAGTHRGPWPICDEPPARSTTASPGAGAQG
jgi:hypothetical protein